MTKRASSLQTLRRLLGSLFATLGFLFGANFVVGTIGIFAAGSSDHQAAGIAGVGFLSAAACLALASGLWLYDQFRPAWKRVVVSGVLLYLAAWACTALFARPAVDEYVEGRFVVQLDGYYRSDSDSVRGVRHDPPWYYITTRFPACPFVVVVDHGFMAAPLMGAGGRSIIVWYGFGSIDVGGFGIWIS